MNVGGTAEMDLRRLTIMSMKPEMYADEEGNHLRSGLTAAHDVFGPALTGVLDGLAVLVIQPDAIAQRQVELCVSFLGEHGFAPMVAVPFTLRPPGARALWRFQFNAITSGSKAIGEGVYCGRPSLMLLLTDMRPVGGKPASVRLAGLKGSSDPARRVAGQLRTRLGSINRVFGSIHCPDEPIDVLREIAVMFAEPELSRIYRDLRDALSAGMPLDVAGATETVYAAIPEHDFHVERATRRLLAVLDGHGGNGVSRRLVEIVHTVCRHESKLDWHAFALGLGELEIDPYDWDPLLVGSQYVQYELPGTPKLIPSFSGS